MLIQGSFVPRPLPSYCMLESLGMRLNTRYEPMLGHIRRCINLHSRSSNRRAWEQLDMLESVQFQSRNSLMSLDVTEACCAQHDPLISTIRYRGSRPPRSLMWNWCPPCLDLLMQWHGSHW